MRNDFLTTILEQLNRRPFMQSHFSFFIFNIFFIGLVSTPTLPIYLRFSHMLWERKKKVVQITYTVFHTCNMVIKKH